MNPFWLTTIRREIERAGGIFRVDRFTPNHPPTDITTPAAAALAIVTMSSFDSFRPLPAGAGGEVGSGAGAEVGAVAGAVAGAEVGAVGGADVGTEVGAVAGAVAGAEVGAVDGADVGTEVGAGAGAEVGAGEGGMQEVPIELLVSA